MIQIQCKMIRYQSEVVCLIVGAAGLLWPGWTWLDWTGRRLISIHCWCLSQLWVETGEAGECSHPKEMYKGENNVNQLTIV